MSSEPIKLVLTAGDDTETVWAEPLGGGRYRIDSIPFFAYNVSAGDVVEASSDGELLRPTALVEKGGHRTLRVAFPEEQGGVEGAAARALAAELERLGCAYEGFEPMLLAVDVPPEVELDPVLDALERTEAEWEYGDPQPDKPGLGEEEA